MPAWAGLDFERVRFCLQLFWSPFVPVVFGNVQPIRIHLLRIYLKAWGGPRREDFLSLSEMITFHSKWVPCSVHVNFQDGNISLLEWKIAFWNLKTKEEALRNTQQVKRWNSELLEQRKHLWRTNCCFVKAKDNLPSQEIFELQTCWEML